MLKARHMEEIWKDIPGFVGAYQASNLGRIRSLFRPVYNSRYRLYVFHGRILKQRTDSYGYLVVNLSVDGWIKTKKVHRLVWEAFNGPIPDGLTVNHIDEDKTNNNLDNLNLMTVAENNSWGTRNKRSAMSNSETRRGKYTYEKNPKARSVMEYSKDGVPVCLWFTVKAAQEHHNVSYQTVLSALTGKTKSLRDGTRFEYYERETV